MNDGILKVRKALQGIGGSGDIICYGWAKLSMLIQRLTDAGVQNIMGPAIRVSFPLTMDKVRLVHRTAIKSAGRKSLNRATVGRSLTKAKALTRDAVLKGVDAIMAITRWIPLRAIKPSTF